MTFWLTARPSRPGPCHCARAFGGRTLGACAGAPYLALPWRCRSKAASEQTSPTPSTCAVKSRTKARMAGAHLGSETYSTNGVSATDASSSRNMSACAAAARHTHNPIPWAARRTARQTASAPPTPAPPGTSAPARRVGFGVGRVWRRPTLLCRSLTLPSLQLPQSCLVRPVGLGAAPGARRPRPSGRSHALRAPARRRACDQSSSCRSGDMLRTFARCRRSVPRAAASIQQQCLGLQHAPPPLCGMRLISVSCALLLPH